MEYLTVILSSSSVGVVGLFIAYYICRKCRQSECTAHLQDVQGNHFDISLGTPHVNVVKVEPHEVKGPISV
jgi:hypothetical protein